MNLTLNTRVQTNTDVICTELTDRSGSPQAVLLNIATQKYFSLNETGIRIWKVLEQGLPLSSAVADLTSRYEVSPEQAGASVLRLATALAEANLVIPVNAPA